MKIGHKFVDSFTMQNAPAAGDNVGKEPRAACVILGIERESILTKLHVLDSVYFIESENGIECLEYKGCGLAILDATEQVGFPSCCKSVAITHFPHPSLELACRGAKDHSRSRRIEADKCKAKLGGQEPIGEKVWQA